jgi:hypothetical protein
MRSAHCGNSACAQDAASRFEICLPDLIAYNPRHMARIAYACDPADASSGILFLNSRRYPRTSPMYSALGIGGINDSIGGPSNLTPCCRAGYQLRIHSHPA